MVTAARALHDGELCQLARVVGHFQPRHRAAKCMRRQADHYTGCLIAEACWCRLHQPRAPYRPRCQTCRGRSPDSGRSFMPASQPAPQLSTSFSVQHIGVRRLDSSAVPRWRVQLSGRTWRVGGAAAWHCVSSTGVAEATPRMQQRISIASDAACSQRSRAGLGSKESASQPAWW